MACLIQCDQLSHRHRIWAQEFMNGERCSLEANGNLLNFSVDFGDRISK
jgi:hypothetical protein